MTRLLIFGLLLFLGSCNTGADKNSNDEIKNNLVSKTDDNIEQINVNDLINAHDTFNEDIDPIPQNLQTFVPQNYSVINISTGDINSDGLPDKILVLRTKTEELTSNYGEDKPDKRPMLLLLGQNNNSFKLEYENDNAVYCIDCAGVFGDPFIQTTIKDGSFSINHGIAGGHHWDQVITFKYNKTKKNWFLFEDHYVSYKLNKSNDPNAEALIIDVDNLKNSNDFGTIAFDEFNIYNEDGN
jgi:hypothetical protein